MLTISEIFLTDLKKSGRGAVKAYFSGATGNAQSKISCKAAGTIFGIAPEIEVKLTDEQTQNFFFLTSETDPQLQKAMETVG